MTDTILWSRLLTSTASNFLNLSISLFLCASFFHCTISLSGSFFPDLYLPLWTSPSAYAPCLAGITMQAKMQGKLDYHVANVLVDNHDVSQSFCPIPTLFYGSSDSHHFFSCLKMTEPLPQPLPQNTFTFLYLLAFSCLLVLWLQEIKW